METTVVDCKMILMCIGSRRGWNSYVMNWSVRMGWAVGQYTLSGLWMNKYLTLQITYTAGNVRVVVGYQQNVTQRQSE